MAAHVNQLIEAQHAAIDARPRFLAVFERTERERNPRLMPMWDRAFCVRPGIPWGFNNNTPYLWDQYETDGYSEAVAAAKGYLFCGASTVTIRYYSADRRTETVETWRAL